MGPVARVARYGACTEWYGANTEHVWSVYRVGMERVQVRSKYGVGMMQVLITIIQYHEIL